MPTTMMETSSEFQEAICLQQRFAIAVVESLPLSLYFQLL
jgi:hypothetical protein